MQFIRKDTLTRLGAMLLAVSLILGAWPPFRETASAASVHPVKVVQIAAAQNNSIALKSDGTVIAWGSQAADWAKPPEGLKDVVEIYAKDSIFLARKSNGTVVAWGSNNVGETSIPSGLTNVISMAGAGSHTLMLAETPLMQGAGTVIAWGLNGNGQTVVPEEAKSSVIKVAAGAYYSMALKFNGTVVDWGSNGTGATSKPADLNSVVAIDAGYMYALALKSNGIIVAWGKEYNGNGILSVPAGLTDVIAISAGKTHALALKRDGTVVGWGDNYNGKATPPAGLTDVVAISAGINHSLALKRDGTVVSWGEQTAVPGDNELSGLTIEEGESNTAFSPSITSYQYDIDPGVSNIHIKADLKDFAYSALYINDQLQPSGQSVAVAVPTTGAVIKVRVEPYMKPPKTYTLTVSRDREPPALTFSPNGSAAPLRAIYTFVQVTDAMSGVNESTLEYAWTQSASAPADGWTHFSLSPYTHLAQLMHAGADGDWYLHIRGKDYTGNLANATSAPFLIDNTPPMMSITMKTEDGHDYPNDAWTAQNVVVTAEATDVQSDVVVVKYTLDGGKTWANYADPITLSDSGIHTLIIQASDAIGNVRVDSRTVKISKGDLKLTLTMVKVPDGGDYASGEWTNSSVQVSAMAETGEYAMITSFNSSWNGEAEEAYDEGSTIVFFQQGMSFGEFKVTDSLGNSLSVPFAINIDRSMPTVSFSPDGNESSAREASVTVAAADSGGSSLVESTLEYVWTQSTGTPTEGWLPLNNGSILKKEGVNGDWYLHVQGKDTAGNEVHAVSGRFVLDNSPLNSTISPDTASFDKKISAQADVATMLSLKGNTLEDIRNGGTSLVPGTDYTVAGNTVTILKSYLVTQPLGITSLTFTFSNGADRTLEIAVSDTTPSTSIISPDIGNFDKKTSAQADVVTTLTLNNNTLAGIRNGGAVLVPGTDYTVTGNTVTILKGYLVTQPLGITSLTFTFSAGEIQTLILMISDTTAPNNLISPDAGSFDKRTSAQADVVTVLTLNNSTLTGIHNGGTALVAGTDYTVEGHTVTILKSYLAAQPVGITNLTFTFSDGADQTLVITVSDTTLLPGYTVTYSGNGSTQGSEPLDEGSYAQGAAVPVYGNLGNLSKAGCTFAGWNTQADGNGTNYAAGAIFTMGTANVTLYAKWISSNADLSNLTLSNSTLNPTFASTTTSYTVNVKNSISSIAVTATVLDAVYSTVTATVYNDIGMITSGPILLTSSGVSPLLPLNVGINWINLVVTAEDGTTKTYVVTVNRAAHEGGGGDSTTSPTAPSEEQAPDGSTEQPLTEGPSTEPPPTDTNPTIPTITFSDIIGHWAEAHIKQAATNGIVNGYPDGTFKPNHTVTRAEFTVMLMNTLKLKEEGAMLSFTDSSKIGPWAQKAVAQAIQAGIIKGYKDGTFRPGAEITRAEMAMMLANASGLSLEVNAATGFADDKNIPLWAKGAVAAIKKLELVKGKGLNEFDPEASTTRAEAVTVLMRILALD